MLSKYIVKWLKMKVVVHNCAYKWIRWFVKMTSELKCAFAHVVESIYRVALLTAALWPPVSRS